MVRLEFNSCKVDLRDYLVQLFHLDRCRKEGPKNLSDFACLRNQLSITARGPVLAFTGTILSCELYASHTVSLD